MGRMQNVGRMRYVHTGLVPTDVGRMRYVPTDLMPTDVGRMRYVPTLWCFSNRMILPFCYLPKAL